MDKIEALEKSIFCKRPDVSTELWNRLCRYYFKENGFLYFCSSGSTSSSLKVFEISFKKMLGHAKEVNDFFEITNKDNWLLSLPSFYMGGLSILFRAYQNGASVFSPHDLSINSIVKSCEELNITHLSLVPRQIHDFLQLNLSFPKSVKMVFIGGDSLTIDNFNALKDQPPIFFATYGASEVCSQVATSLIKEFNTFKVLPWNKVITNDTIEINSPFIYDRLFVIKDNEVEQQIPSHSIFKTTDRGVKSGDLLRVLGRSDRQIKCSGLFIDLDLLEIELKKFFPNFDFYLCSIQSPQRGREPVLITKSPIQDSVLLEFKIYKSRVVDKFLYTESGKLKKTYL